MIIVAWQRNLFQLPRSEIICVRSLYTKNKNQMNVSQKKKFFFLCAVMVIKNHKNHAFRKIKFTEKSKKKINLYFV
jgi:hypothetical protein